MSLEDSVDDEIIKISQELKALESEAESYKKELLGFPLTNRNCTQHRIYAMRVFVVNQTLYFQINFSA